MTKNNYIALVACRDLKNDDGSSAEVSMVRMDSAEEEEIGKTAELFGDTPVFNKMFELECENTNDLLKVTILAENEQSRGVATFSMAIVLEHEKTLGYLEMSADRGAVVVHVAQKTDAGSIKLILKAKDLKNVEGYSFGTNLRKPDPFYVVSKLTNRSGGEDQWAKVFTSPTITGSLDPEWDESEMEIKDLCEGGFDKTLKVEVFDEE